MAGPVMNVTEARQKLPQLLREVSAGAKTVRIGLRGKATAVLVSADEYDALTSRAAATPASELGWTALRFEIIGTADELDAAMKQVRKDLNGSLTRRVDRYARDLSTRRSGRS